MYIKTVLRIVILKEYCTPAELFIGAFNLNDIFSATSRWTLIVNTNYNNRTCWLPQFSNVKWRSTWSLSRPSSNKKRRSCRVRDRSTLKRLFNRAPYGRSSNPCAVYVTVKHCETPTTFYGLIVGNLSFCVCIFNGEKRELFRQFYEKHKGQNKKNPMAEQVTF